MANAVLSSMLVSIKHVTQQRAIVVNDCGAPIRGPLMRRMGMNLHSAAADRQTYRENTIASFRRAAAAGASFVEFDVQVAKLLTHAYSRRPYMRAARQSSCQTPNLLLATTCCEQWASHEGAQGYAADATMRASACKTLCRAACTV